MPKFRIKMFGTLDITGPDGVQIVVSGSRQQALLAFLALNADNPPSRDRVMSLLWGDRFTEQARQSLRQGLSKLRQAIDADEQGAIWATHDRIGIDLKIVEVDLLEFSNLIGKNTPEADEKAIDLFQSTVLDGLYVREAAFEEWLVVERSRINELAFPVFERLAAHYLKSAEQAKSQNIAQRLVAIDPLREGSHRLLMRILAQSGQRAAAIKQFNTCADILKRDLDVEPDPETQMLLDNIKSPTSISDYSAQMVEAGSNEESQNAAPVASAKASITVLPFGSMGGGEELEAFSDGLTEDITSALTKYRWLDVIVQLLVESGDSSTARLRQLAMEQNVRYSVEGSVRRFAEKLRITAQLVELETGKYIWVDRSDRDAEDLFALQDELSKTIAAAVETELVAFEGDKVRARASDAMSAWDCYHLGLATQYEFSTEGNARAQSLFRRAIDLDPMFASAHARLSYALVLSAIYFEASQISDLLDEALELARLATRLDDHDAVARFALGRVFLARGEYEQSIVALNLAIKLNPSLAQAHCGLGDSLAYLGRAQEAIPEFEEAVRLSPRDPHRWAFSMYGALASIINGDYERAVSWARSSVRVPNSHYWANAALVSALGHLGRLDEAKAAVQDLLELKPEFSCDFAKERLFYVHDKAQIGRYVEGLKKAGVR